MIRIALAAPAALLPLLLASPPAGAQVAVPSAAEQLAAAVQAAPEDRRDDATVIGWTEDGGTTVLREGTGELVCLADEPGDEEWSVACYHRSLEPYMARGRELRAMGVEGEERNRIRWAEMEEGTLPMPDGSATLYVLHGDGWDEEAGAVRNPYLRYVIYVPGATAESTGLPTTPAEGVPWLMFPGTPGAHVMIAPPRG